MIATVALLAWIPGVVDVAGFQGGLDLSLGQRAVAYLPLAVAVLGASTVLLAASGWIGAGGPREVTLQYAALAVAAIALVPLLVGWHLIG